MQLNFIIMLPKKSLLSCIHSLSAHLFISISFSSHIVFSCFHFSCLVFLGLKMSWLINIWSLLAWAFVRLSVRQECLFVSSSSWSLKTWLSYCEATVELSDWCWCLQRQHACRRMDKRLKVELIMSNFITWIYFTFQYYSKQLFWHLESVTYSWLV